MTKKLLSWFDRHRRALPWRDGPCGARDPYRVWLAEIMLQQTTVVAVIPYYQRFLAAWPDVEALAAAPDNDVMTAWAGLGYYARARNLLKCARLVAAELGGHFPKTVPELEALPGIGPYSAAAIASIAFNRPAAAVDGNVMRVLARRHALKLPMPQGRREVEALVQGLVPAERPGDFTEALIELGATVCRPKSPACSACPWAKGCQARASGTPEAWPVKAPKKAKPTRRGWALWVEDDQDRILLVKRPDKGLLGGMTAFPVTDWGEVPLDPAQGLSEAQALLPWGREFEALSGHIRHTFTHFHLELGVIRGRGPSGANSPDGAFWSVRHRVEHEALPGVMRKVIGHIEAAKDN